jgi:hypothetical protein
MCSLAGAYAGDVGAAVQGCFGWEDHTAPVFHALLSSNHWAARHAAMLALLHYSRSPKAHHLPLYLIIP